MLQNHVCIVKFTLQFRHTLIGTNYKRCLQANFHQVHILMPFYTIHKICVPFSVSYLSCITSVCANICEHCSKVVRSFLLSNSPRPSGPNRSDPIETFPVFATPITFKSRCTSFTIMDTVENVDEIEPVNPPSFF